MNKELSSFSRLRETKVHNEPFQRTPTLKIKRYLYSLTHKKEEQDRKGRIKRRTKRAHNKKITNDIKRRDIYGQTHQLTYE